MMEPKIYYASRKHFLFFLFILLLLLGGSLWLVGYALHDPSRPSLSDKIPALLLSSLFCLISLIGVVLVTRRVWEKKPTVILEADGVTFSKDVNGFEYIPWSRIRGTRIQSQSVNAVGRVRYLVIDVDDPEELIKSVSHLLVNLNLELI